MADELSIADVQPFILVGGISSRFGSPKALVKIDGQRQIDRLHEPLKLCFGRSPILVCSDWTASMFDEFVLLQDRDRSQGPLSGVATALLHLQEHPAIAKWALMLTCDLFSWRDPLAEALLASRTPKTLAVCFGPIDRPQPFPSLWHIDLEAAVLAASTSQDRSVRRFLQSHADVDFKPLADQSWLQSFNTPQELSALSSSINSTS